MRDITGRASDLLSLSAKWCISAINSCTCHCMVVYCIMQGRGKYTPTEPEGVSDMANLDTETINEVADWMETIGYDFDRDPDGLWFEQEATEHRYCDIMELMVKYAASRPTAIDRDAGEIATVLDECAPILTHGFARFKAEAMDRIAALLSRGCEHRPASV